MCLKVLKNGAWADGEPLPPGRHSSLLSSLIYGAAQSLGKIYGAQ